VILFNLGTQGQPVAVTRGNLAVFLTTTSLSFLPQLWLQGLLPASRGWLGLVLLVPYGIGTGLGTLLFRPDWAWFYRRFAYAADRCGGAGGPADLGLNRERTHAHHRGGVRNRNADRRVRAGVLPRGRRGAGGRGPGAAGVRSPHGTGYEAVQPILDVAAEIDILILGTGTEIAHPPTAFRKAVEAAGVGVEPMASPQACRTYNVLLSEGRRVGAALLPVG
jgi:hypothetical protein